MKIKLDMNKRGYASPGSRIEKLFCLTAYLHEKRHRDKKVLAEILEKSERQLRRDLKEISQHYDLKYDEYGRPYID